MVNQQLSTNTFCEAKWVVDATAGQGTHTTIAAALTAASSGDTIFIRPGTYTENITLKAGVNLTAFGSDSSLNQTGKVIISGSCTFSLVGSVTISGIQLQTNSANNIIIAGSAATILNLNNCNLNCTNNTGISFTTSNTAATINCIGCTGDLGTTGIGLYSVSSTGTLNIYNSHFTNSGASTTATTNSAGTVNFEFCFVYFPLTTSSAAILNVLSSQVDSSAQNTTPITTAGTGSTNVQLSSVGGGSASAISIGTGTTGGVYHCLISSSNTNAITGAGTIVYSNLTFSSTSLKINTTTQTGGTIQGGLTQAPSVGFLGEQIRATAASIAMVSATPKTLTSISLTAGIWDISAVGEVTYVGGGTVCTVNISTTTNTITGTQGDAYYSTVIAAMGQCGGAIPSFRVTLTATTTYYLVMSVTFVTSGTTFGRISATRVG